MATVIDPFGRVIDYVRISVTDRCDFRCVYCMAEEMTFLPKAELLTLEELDRLGAAFVGLGVRKIRLTGGEPLGRRNVTQGAGGLLAQTLLRGGVLLAEHTYRGRLGVHISHRGGEGYGYYRV